MPEINNKFRVGGKIRVGRVTGNKQFFLPYIHVYLDLFWQWKTIRRKHLTNLYEKNRVIWSLNF